ncbi:MAG: carboxylesterase family protein [Sandaracinus sp.]|nr:carboxylesterase family protein [Sandaracinus sp.]
MRTILALVLATSVGCGDDDTSMSDAATPLDATSDAPAIDAPPTDAPDEGRPRVTLTSGDVIGVVDDGVHVFRSIPYAAPPVGALRFARPEPHPGWSTPLDTATTDPALACPQRNDGTLLGEEDCLVASVFAPADASDAPVMVFVHGGGFSQGSGNLPLYDGAALARRGVVVVTFNYRLGTLGFLAGAALEEDDGAAGNFGLHDQLLALRWVRDHARAFGGDPDEVTIFGESAGAVSVGVHVASPESAGLFARAIAQSGGGGYPTKTRAQQYGRGAELASAMGCSLDDLACLRNPALDLATIVDAASSGAPSGLGLPDVGPHVDGLILPGEVFARVRDGRANDVPWVIGHNADEASVFTLAVSVPDEDAFRRVVGSVVGPAFVDSLVTLYPASEFGGRWKSAYDALFADLAFVCSAVALTEAASDGAPAYGYHFTRSLGPRGSFHGLELFYVFGNLDVVPGYVPSATDRALTETMQRAWTGFARAGRPDFEPGWSAYDPASPSFAILNEPPSTASEIRGGRCGALRELGLVP